MWVPSFHLITIAPAHPQTGIFNALGFLYIRGQYQNLPPMHVDTRSLFTARVDLIIHPSSPHHGLSAVANLTTGGRVKLMTHSHIIEMALVLMIATSAIYINHDGLAVQVLFAVFCVLTVRNIAKFIAILVCLPNLSQNVLFHWHPDKILSCFELCGHLSLDHFIRGERTV